MLKKLPIGIQTFSKIREGNYLYIDKTKIAFDLINTYEYVFLSRPRRFGKSLFLDTLKNIFEGKKDFFKGLYIYDKWNWQEKYPVIKIDFAGGTVSDRDGLDIRIKYILNDNAERLGVTIDTDTDLPGIFTNLIKKSFAKFNSKLVVLIDEYDKPILDNVENLQNAEKIRDGLKSLYSVLKEQDRNIKFVFLTGVSKFSRVSIFSGLNNIVDISIDSEFGNICGYTQHDIESEFSLYLKDVDMVKLKLWYNGYNFLGDKVYNPFDILLFIQKGKIYKNYWFETGTPGFLIKLIKKNHYFLPDFENLEVNESLINSFDIEDISIETIMFQTGYLTIKEEIDSSFEIHYKLIFPNLEVKISFNSYLINHFNKSSSNVALKSELYNIFESGNVTNLEPVIKRLFAGIAYNNFTKNEIESYEGFYASILYAHFAALGLEIIAEDVTNRGRIDLTVKLNSRVYIFEFKVIDEDPLKQIKEKRYFEKYPGEIFLIGIVFSKDERNISQFVWEKV